MLPKHPYSGGAKSSEIYPLLAPPDIFLQIPVRGERVGYTLGTYVLQF